MLSFTDFLVVTALWCAVGFFLLSVFLWGLGYRFRQEQNAYLYYPDEPSDSRTVCQMPESDDFPNSENVAIETCDGVTLRGFLMWPGAAPSPHSSLATLQSAKLGSPTAVGGSAAAAAAAAGPLRRPGQSSGSSDNGLRGREGGGGGPPSLNAPPSFVLIYFHGNAGNVGHRVPIAAAFAERLHCAVLMVDYRGYGLSDNAEVNQEGLEKDSQACLDFILQDRRLPHEHIYVMGTSLGGAVAIQLASKPRNIRHIAAVIVENTFTSISDMTSVVGAQVINHTAPCPSAMLCIFVYYIVPLVLRVHWCSVRTVASVTVPMLFLSGKKDELVPPVQMKQLYSVACKSESKKMRRFVEMADGMHNNMPLMPGYFEAIQLFIAEVEQERSVDVV